MVFSGLVQSIGLATFNPTTNILQVQCSDLALPEKCLSKGDSIAVNGCCLTLITPMSQDEIAEFFVMEETRRLTNLCYAKRVNIELPMKLGEHIGGHLVTGHVDGVGKIAEVIPHHDGSCSLWIELSHIANFFSGSIVHKGSIAIDGVSLTIAEIRNESQVRVDLIPYTLEHTCFRVMEVGDLVNVEFDKWGNRESGDRDPIDELMMKRAISLGEYGKVTAPPNPWVGCVITDRYGNIISEGFHRKAGTAHAEVVAIQQAIALDRGKELEGSTVYSTLEPCSHFGRTAPCADLLIEHKIGRVVIAVMDPDPKVNGRGVQKLQSAGISVTTGVMEREAAVSLRSYLHQRRSGRPWVVLKIASSLDGKIAAADGNSRWITDEEARKDAHKRFRSTSQAIIVGSATASKDDPELTVRSFPDGTDISAFTHPTRIVIGSSVKLAPQLLNTKMAPTLIYTNKKIPPGYLTELSNKLVEVLQGNSDEDGHPDFCFLLEELGKRGVLQVLVEGGAQLGSSLLRKGLVNQLVVYHAPVIMGSCAKAWNQASMGKTMENVRREWERSGDVRVLGEDICIEYVKKEMRD